MKFRIAILVFLPILLFALTADISVNPKVKSSDGTEIVYTATGNAEPALVFIHGWSCDKSYWKTQVEKFSQQYKVVTIDLAGHGESGTQRKDYTVKLFGSDVAAVVNDLKLSKVILIGHSMGGSVILEAAKLLDKKVIGLIGVDTYQSFTDDWPAEQKEKFMESFAKDFKTTAVGFVKQMFPKGADSTIASTVAEDMSSAPPAVAISAMRNLFYYDPLPTLSKLELPIISINCDMYPVTLEENKKYVKSFSFKQMKGVGHFLFLERPNEFNKLLSEAVSEIINDNGVKK
ncbi:MAG: alpha/beta hydrolase [Ignavibacteria bacterium]|nr:alpha/beta hydrolase [Ignavibacteria bacterium]